MKQMVPHEIYSYTVPRISKYTGSFFQSPSWETFYFTSKFDADEFKRMCCSSMPDLALNPIQYAINEKDKYGKTKWVLFRKVENLSLSNTNIENPGYHGEKKYFKLTPELESAINEIERNATTFFQSCILVVKEASVQIDESDMGPNTLHITYGAADEVDNKTRFLHINKYSRCFVERSHSVKIDPMSTLLKNQKIAQIDKQMAELRVQREAVLGPRMNAEF